jgi:hypothetical protein
MDTTECSQSTINIIQDAAPAHAAKGTIKDLQERGIVCLQWPTYSPDLMLCAPSPGVTWAHVIELVGRAGASWLSLCLALIVP